MSPTQRSLAYLRKEGYVCQVVERWNPFAHCRQDLFNFIDIVCIKEGEMGVLGVQTTSTANMSARIKKINDLVVSTTWLTTGNHIWVIGWSKKGARGKVKKWTPTIKVID